MKISKSIFFMCLILLLCLGIHCNKSNNTKDKPIGIGVIIPLTGDYAKIGTDIKRSIEIAKTEAISKGIIKENQIQIYFEDNKLDANNTVSAYNMLRADKNIQVVITVTSKCILALKPIANKDEVLLLNASAISTEIEDADDYCYSLIPNAKSEAGYLANYIFKDKGIRDIALIYRNDQSGQSFNDWFNKAFTNLGGKIVFTESHPVNTTNFQTLITKIESNTNIGGVLVASLGNEVANFSKQSKELNYDLPIFTYETINQPSSINIAGETIDRIEFVSPKFNPTDSVYKSFKNELFKVYATNEINYYMISHYDAFMLTAKLINEGAVTGKEMKDKIVSLKTVKLLGPKIEFGQFGIANTEMQIMGFRNKEIFIIK